MLQAAVGGCGDIVPVWDEATHWQEEAEFLCVGPNALTSGKKKTEKRDKQGHTIKTCLRHFETESAKIYLWGLGGALDEGDR